MSGVMDVLRLAQFSAHGYCRVCCGWEVITGQGECPYVHTADCEYAASMVALDELISAADWASRMHVRTDLARVKQLRLREALQRVTGGV